MIKIAISELLCQCPMERKTRPWCVLLLVGCDSHEGIPLIPITFGLR